MAKKIKTTTEKYYHAISKFGNVSKGDIISGDSHQEGRFYRYNEGGEIIEEGLYMDNYYSYNRPLIICASKYNSEGKLIEDLFFSREEPFEIPIEKIIYIYDNQGRITEEQKYIVTSQNTIQNDLKQKTIGEFSLDEIRNYIYDNHGNLIEKNVLLNDGSFRDRVVFNCDANGNRTEVLIFNLDNSIDEKILGKFNEFDQLIEEKHFVGENRLEETAQYKFDDRWNLIEEVYFDGDSNLSSIIKMVYDDRKNCIEMNIFSPERKLKSKEINEFNNQNLVIKNADYDSEGNLKRKQLYKYDRRGNELQIITFDFENGFEMTRIEYEYDEFNNHIKSIDYINEIHQSICEREIEYYE
ncbi:MAG: hypothetical protein PF484_09700 [Bacteroidales bacterium]|jgi:hypothetical protein|nr:hypothetical protein [Bacteroidales bacterium]